MALRSKIGLHICKDLSSYFSHSRYYSSKIDWKRLRPMILKRIENRSKNYPIQNMVPVAEDVLKARTFLFHGVSTLIKVSPFKVCKCCSEVYIGENGHMIKTCHGYKHGAIKQVHEWTAGSLSDILVPVEAFHLQSMFQDVIRHDQRFDYERVPAVLELCWQAGAEVRDEHLCFSSNLDACFLSPVELKNIATYTMCAYETLRSGLQKLMLVYPTKVCTHCSEVHIGPSGHKARLCGIFKYESRRGSHFWKKAEVDNLVPPKVVWRRRKQDPLVLHNEGTSNLNSVRPRRVFVPQRKELDKPHKPISGGLRGAESQQAGEEVAELIDQRLSDDTYITPPSVTGTMTMRSSDKNEARPKDEIIGQKKVQFCLRETPDCQKMEWDASDRNVGGEIGSKEPIQVSDAFPRAESGGVSSLLAKRNMLMQDQQSQFPTCMSQSSTVLGSSCATTMSVHSRSAPMMNSITYSSRSQRNGSTQMEMEQLEEKNVKLQPISQGNAVQSRSIAESSYNQEHAVGYMNHGKGPQGSKAKESDISRDGHVDHTKEKLNKAQDFDVTNVQSHAPLTKDLITSGKIDPSKSSKPDKSVSGTASAPRKKSYDPELFFRVNGKMYQKLGKIGSGGSSEVHKVISANCTIFALKKIKLKGRDYSTAYGFCQEIEYLNKLKGKDNIIQLIDYEVTDKTLLAEVMKGSMTMKDGRIKEDGYIYMVLEYGEIDLAHMLSLKWKEMDVSNLDMDENWLRFYWQQILQAVNTIHEERIVHSDLKPANFLLVRGALKLIDFGIAKAIMSDTTNIQRDSQVGTLSYMSPEAFMCNEIDAEGNPIKCGRPSDIWSLGCILYQMVYSRTPFSEYKTFWAKFKVITDRNHEIIYGSISNPWLLDLMKKCLAWERNERWRIPELLKHPFLVPPVPSQSMLPQDRGCKLIQQIAEAYRYDHQSSRLCSEIQSLLMDTHNGQITDNFCKARDQHCGLLSHVSRLCSRLQQQLAKLDNDERDMTM